jgi:hypothetical protein
LSRDAKANSFQRRRTEFKNKVNFNKEHCIKVIQTSSYVRYGRLSNVSFSVTVMDIGKETVTTKGCRLLLDASQFAATAGGSSSSSSSGSGGGRSSPGFNMIHFLSTSHTSFTKECLEISTTVLQNNESRQMSNMLRIP